MQDEAGTLAMAYLRRAGAPEIAHLVEIYQDKPAYQAHAKSPQYQRFLQKPPDMLTDLKKKTALTAKLLTDKSLPADKALSAQLLTFTVQPENAPAAEELLAQYAAGQPDIMAFYAVQETEAPPNWRVLQLSVAGSDAVDAFKALAEKLPVQHVKRSELPPAEVQLKGGLHYPAQP